MLDVGWPNVAVRRTTPKGGRTVKDVLTQERVKELFSYDAETGILRWRVRPVSHIHVDDVAGHRSNKGYLIVKVANRAYKAHRIIWLYAFGSWPQEIDHINRVKDDNRLSNLREVTQSENMLNRDLRTDNHSGVTGVYWSKEWQKWAARFRGKHLGYSNSKAVAECMRLAAEAAYRGLRSTD